MTANQENNSYSHWFGNQENNSYSHWSGHFLACLDASLIPLYPHFNGHQLEIQCWTSNRIQTRRIRVFFSSSSSFSLHWELEITYS